jgi:hypothetical protein
MAAHPGNRGIVKAKGKGQERRCGGNEPAELLVNAFGGPGMSTSGAGKGIAGEISMPAKNYQAKPPQDVELARLGRRLLGRDGGFGCTSCHDVGSTEARGAFEVPGVNFIDSRERLRKDFIHRWMMNPVRVSPETRMPQFALEGGRSPFADVLDGDARRQFEAIWQLLLLGRALRLEERGKERLTAFSPSGSPDPTPSRLRRGLPR